MKFLLRLLALLVIIWLAMLLTGYGVLTGSNKNVAGMGLQCKYLTARGMVIGQYLHTDSGIIGVTDCPLLRKSSDVVDNGL
ncbi:putative exported protein [Erwinia sp. Ejp617]|nr:YobH family protein [Erwinia sp. Ejp617]ADP12783.1 putative exported protein [Erwinia sp. Ejp617]